MSRINVLLFLGALSLPVLCLGKGDSFLIQAKTLPRTLLGCESKVLNPNSGRDIFRVTCSDLQSLAFSPLANIEENQRWNIFEGTVGVSSDNDPLRSDQWGLDLMHSPDQSIGAPAKVKIAVIDTGVDYKHEDLYSQISVNSDEVPENGLDDDKNGYIDDVFGWNALDFNSNPNDFHHHGTHVAGILGAKSHNGLGIKGTSNNLEIIPIRFIGEEGGTTESAIVAFDYAIARGAKIVNASWGGSSDSPLLRKVFERSRDLGILVIAASGNDTLDNDEDPTYPASFDLDNIISVAATDLKGELASFSNWGAKSVDIAAPGESILSTLPRNRYGFLEGTSMAAPYIVGVAAEIWSQNPDWNYQQVREFLLSHCVTTDTLRSTVACGGYFSW